MDWELVFEVLASLELVDEVVLVLDEPVCVVSVVELFVGGEVVEGIEVDIGGAIVEFDVDVGGSIVELELEADVGGETVVELIVAGAAVVEAIVEFAK